MTQTIVESVNGIVLVKGVDGFEYVHMSVSDVGTVAHAYMKPADVQRLISGLLDILAVMRDHKEES